MSNLIAHRGLNNKKYKENTKEAIINSLKQDYIKGIKIDIRLTKDNKIVVIHDSTINRTSNGQGKVKEMTLKELKKYNFGTKENPSQISTLKEIIELIPQNKLILIEIKENKNEETFIKEFYKIIKKYLYKNIYVMSFNEKLINKLKQTHPNLNCGLLKSKIIKNEYKNNNYDFIVQSSHNIESIINYQKPLFIWAINNKKKYLEIKSTLKDSTYYIVKYPKDYL